MRFNLSRINKSDLLLYTAIIIFFLCEWLFDLAIILSDGLFPYKRFIVIIFLLLMNSFFFMKLKVGSFKTLICLFCFFISVTTSSFITGYGIGGSLYYLPSLLFPLAIISTTLAGLNAKNLMKFIKLVYWIALIQLPVILLQIASYRFFPDAVKARIGPHDFATGTFFVAGDVTLALLFLVFLLIFMFHPGCYLISKKRWYNLIYFSICIILVNSKLSLLLMLLFWGLFFLRKLTLRKKVGFIIVAIPLFIFANSVLVGYSERNVDGDLFMRVGRVFVELTRLSDVSTNISNEGVIHYTRSYAFYHLFIADPFRYFGYGPGAFNDEFPVPLGHFWNNYKDIGIVGLGFSYLYLLSFFLTFRKNNLRNYLIFTALGLTITIQVLVSPATLLLFALFLRFDELLIIKLHDANDHLAPA